MKYNPKKHNRRSIRLKGYDYSKPGFYFITICAQNRACLFGSVINAKMVLNDAGKMVEHWYYKLSDKFNDIKCHAMVVMPNHFHCIIEIVGGDDSAVGADPLVGADPRVCPCPNEKDEHAGSSLPGSSPPGTSLPRVVQWFKTMTTNAYIRGVKNDGWPRFNGKLWQRNYWERIVRDQKAYERFTQYIIDNPKKWWTDKLNNGKGNQVLEPFNLYGAQSRRRESA